ncbi:hypothetical protein KAU19_08420 [Candidatus Parcubacteria bacterium]|nr:hypothetical protein [Candidatus Parcubacteria bacterium]
MDWFAIVSLGTYPTPTPTVVQRASYAVSYGLLSSVVESLKNSTHIFGARIGHFINKAIGLKNKWVG